MDRNEAMNALNSLLEFHEADGGESDPPEIVRLVGRMRERIDAIARALAD